MKVAIKLDMCGTKSLVMDFPFGLPDVIEHSLALSQIPGLGRSLAEKMRAEFRRMKEGVIRQA